MKQKLLSIAAVLLWVSGMCQQDDPAKYIHYPYSYGTRIDRSWFDKAIHVPRDTIYTKSGLAIKGNVLYYGDSTRWYAAGAGGGGSTITSLGHSFPVGITGTTTTRSLRDSLYFSLDSSITGTLRGRVDTTTMFPVIRSTITAASIERQPVGIIINQPFTSGTIPLDWSQQTGAATISYGGGNGLSMSGGNGSVTNNFVKAQFNSISNNYYYNIPFTIVTKPTDYNGWIGFSKFGIQPMYVRARYAGFTDSMRLVLNINGNDVDSTRRIAMADGNNYSIKISVSNNTVFYGITLLSGTSIVTTKERVYSIPIGYITIAMPCIGNPGFNVGGGSYNKITFQQYDQDIYGADVMIIGTSISQGYYLASFQNNWISKSFDGSEKVYTNYGSSQATMGSLINALPEIYLNHPRVVGVEAGTNDICDATFRPRMNAIIDSLQAHGIEVFWISDFTPNACKDTVIINVCNEQGIVYLNPFADLTTSSLPDGIHPNDFGAMNIAKYLKSKAPQYFGKVGAIEQQSLDGLRNVLVTSPTTGDVLGYNITTKQWNNIPPGSLFILNQTLVAQTANSWINGFMSASAGAGIGDVATSAYMLRIREAGVAGTTDFKGILITNAGASTSSKDAVIGQSGSNGFGITGWANKLVIEGQAAGITLSGYGGDIRYQIGAARTDMGIVTSTGFGFGTISPSHTVTVNGQVKVFAPQAGDIDSIATWKDGVLSSTLASSIVGATPTWQQTLDAGSTLVGDNIITIPSAGSLTFNGSASGGGAFVVNSNSKERLAISNTRSTLSGGSGSGGGNQSAFQISDSVDFSPYLGKIHIDSLRGGFIDTTNFKPVAWNTSSGVFATMNSWAQVSGASGGSGANTALSNLASVAINTSLLPGTDDAIDLGSASKQWRDLYLTGASIYLAGTKTLSTAGLDLPTGGGLRTRTSAGNTLRLQAYDVDGAAYTTFGTLTANNTPTLDLSTAVTVGGNPILTTTAAASAYQPLDADLTTIATLTATTDNFMVATSSAWSSRTPAQARVQLLPSLTGNTLKVLRVNAGESDVEWATASGSGTVTNTGGNLTSNSVVLGAGTVDTKVVAGIITDGVSQLTLGVNTTTLGKVKLFGNTSGDATIQPAAVAGTATVVTLPNASSTLPIFGQQITFSGPTAARTITLPDANFTVARTDAANTFTGTQTFSSTISGSIDGNAATVTTNANLTGDITSVGNATTIAIPSETTVNNNTGGWVTKKVSGSDVTTTGQTLVDVTGLVSGTVTASATYEVDGMLIVTTSAVVTGTEYGLNCTGTGADQSINWIGPSTETGGVQVLNEVGTGANNTAGTPAFNTTSGMSGCIWFHGYVTTGTGSPTMAIRHLKATSGTSTVKIGSTFRYRKL